MSHPTLLPPALGLLLLAAGCAPTLRTVPVPNPATGQIAPAELRIPHPDRRTQSICERNRATDCLDSFWRIEAATADLVVFRYRRVAMTQEDARADPEWVARLTLVTPDGRRVQGRLHERFEVEPRAPLHWQDRGLARTGPLVSRVQSDGSIRTERELQTVMVDESTARYSGANYVIFEGRDLITPETPSVTLEYPGGLLFGAWSWTFAFDGSPPLNAIPSRSPELDRPEWARVGPVRR